MASPAQNQTPSALSQLTSRSTKTLVGRSSLMLTAQNQTKVNVDLGIWSKLTRLIIFLLCLAGMLGVAAWYFPVIKQNERMRRQILKLDEQIAKAEENNRQLKARIDSLRDPKAMERLVRERLGYAKPNETVIRFDPPGGRLR